MGRLSVQAIQRYVHSGTQPGIVKFDWIDTRVILAGYTLFINSLLPRLSMRDGGPVFYWQDEEDDYYLISRIDAVTGQPLDTWRARFGKLFTCPSFGMLSLSPDFMMLPNYCVLDDVFEGDHEDEVLFNPVPCNYDEKPLHSRWYALYLRVPDLEVTSSELLSCLDTDRKDVEGYLRPRLESPLWKRIRERYQGDEQLLRFIYYDTLWYHDGTGIYFVCYDKWSNQQVEDEDTKWMKEMFGFMFEDGEEPQPNISNINRLQACLRTDESQEISASMRVRLGGSISPESGDIALGFLHPYALPYYPPFAYDGYAYKFKRWGILSFGDKEERPEIGHPEQINVDKDPPKVVQKPEWIKPTASEGEEDELFYDPFADDDEERTIRPHRLHQGSESCTKGQASNIDENDNPDGYDDGDEDGRPDEYDSQNENDGVFDYDDEHDGPDDHGGGSSVPVVNVVEETKEDIGDYRFLNAGPINSQMAGESLYLFNVKWKGKTRRIFTEEDKRDVGRFIAENRMNLMEILKHEDIHVLNSHRVLDLDAYALRLRQLPIREGRGGQSVTVSVWRWEIWFHAEPLGRSVARRLGLESGIHVEGDKVVLKDIYSLRPPSFVSGLRSEHFRNFKSFELKIRYERVEESRLSSLRMVSEQEMEETLGIRDMLELEWGVIRYIRSSNRMSDLLAFLWLHHRKRSSYQDGVITHDDAMEYLREQLGWSQSHVRSRLQRLTRLGWITRVRRGYIIHSWTHLAYLNGIPCERVVLVNKDELRDVKGLKSVIASLPGTFGEPLIKYEIARQLGVSVHTVKRNRRGRLREWYRIRYFHDYESREQAEESRVTELHPNHKWTLCLCGYKMAPTKLQENQWVLERSSAARILDLTCVYLIGKSKRLRKSTSILANRGDGALESRVIAWQAMEGSERYTNFEPTPLTRQAGSKSKNRQSPAVRANHSGETRRSIRDEARFSLV